MTRIFAAIVLGLLVGAVSLRAADEVYIGPVSPRQTFNFDPDWKFIRQDVPGAKAVDFNDADWTPISLPHTFNDVDSFRMIISHGSGDRGTFKGVVWYRKHFKISADLSGDKIFLEFEGMRQAGAIFLNGRQAGLYENGITAYGIDITDAVHFGAAENVIAISVDNHTSYQEQATKTGYEWNANNFNPVHGGINRHVRLHAMGKIYQTLPLYYGLSTTGTYIYGNNYDIAGKNVTINVESQVQNSSDDRATVTLSAVVVDRDGKPVARFEGDAVDMVKGEHTQLTASGPLAHARFWSIEDPNLYDVYCILNVDGKVVDVNRITTGFRKAEFKGGAGTGGVYINDKFEYLKGFAQRSTNEWPGLGQAYPDWMHDQTARLIRDCHGNYIRWMHVSPQRVDVTACDRYGIVEVCPAGDKEKDVTGRQWDQRVEVMRDSMIYFRNNPSILFWEAGNTFVTPDQMKQMIDLRKEFDPNGGRVVGARGDSNNEANTALTPVSEYYGVMVGQDRRTEELKGPTDMFRAYSAQRRDRAPIIETEDFRDEGARRFWDDFSPPYFGFHKGPNDTYGWNSETFALAAVERYNAYWINRISNPDPAHARWSGYASIYLTDSDADGRQDSSEVCRVSGKTDAVRLPKEIYYTHRVMQNDAPDAHILGHWSYPTGPDARPTVKTVYVIANTSSVELFVNGKSISINSNPQNGFIFSFPNIKFEPGSLKAVAIKDGKALAQDEAATVGPPAALKLTLMTGPGGLTADGQDIALVDVEAVDAKGHRCPTDDARVDFALSGPGTWRGGYNSGKTDSTNNTYLNTECGINRVAIRAKREAGIIKLTATRAGLTSGTLEIPVHSTQVTDGLSTIMPPRLPAPAEK